MSLLHPTLGELLDRLTILDLKVEHAPERQHFHQEREAIRDAILRRFLNEDLLSALVVVNRRLWNCNEIIAVGEPTLDLGRKMWELNLERNRLIEAINMAAGEYVGPEKV